MSHRSERLERLVHQQLGECCDGDVETHVATLERYAAEGPSEPDADLAALKTLGNDTRYAIVRLLVAADQELCVCEINPLVERSESAVSHALSDLYDAGLVHRRKDGTWRYYEATDRARAVLAALDETRDAATTGPTSIAFVCVENAGRSQMAAALAARERARRGREDAIEIKSGGTQPADAVHEAVVEVMAEIDLDLTDARPREIPRAGLRDVDVVVTMGCSADGVCPATWTGDARDWDLADPKGRSLDEVRAIRDEIQMQVETLFDELETEVPAGG